MASTAGDLGPQHFACKCLNVRLVTSLSDSTPPESSNDPEFEKIHVGDDGIQVTHTRLTLRVKSRGVPIPGTSRCSRFTTLTCLNCDLAVYRVHQVISSEVEAKDLPLLPNDDWVEQEIMKSPSGWVEIHKSCLNGEAIAQAASSEEYSRIYSVLLPPAPETTPTSPTILISPESTASSTPTPTPDIPVSYLSTLPPLLPPPPFTPSHPAFLQILSVAKRESQSLRDAADQKLTQIVRAKAAEVEVKEAELKAEVERLWYNFRQGLDKIQQGRPQAPSSFTPWVSPARTNDHRSSGLKAPVAIPGFNPVSVTAPARTTPPPPRKSGISESLSAYSQLHDKMAQKKLQSTDPTPGTEGMSTQSESPTLVPNSANEREATSILHYRRRVDDNINTAASFRYFMDLDAEMTRAKKERKPGADSDHDETVGIGLPGPSTTNGGDGHTSNPSASGDFKGKAKEEKQLKNKNKHVHFNVQPSARVSKTSSSKKPSDPSKPDSGEMVFDLDDDVAGAAQSEEALPALPLLESPSVPPRRRAGPHRTTGLPASFSALRPASLPAPSQMRSGPHTNIDAYSNNIILSLSRPPAPVSKATNGEKKEDVTDQDTSEDTTDSSPRPTSDSESDSEGEEYHYHSRYGIPGSLPVNIVSSIRPREVLSLASYQQKPPAERQPIAATAPTNGAVQPKRMTSSAIRKATYAERDRSRSLDPGNLDFVAEVDEEDEAEQGDRKAVVLQSVDSGERGRKHALRILQARAELPAEGLWRSLAS